MLPTVGQAEQIDILNADLSAVPAKVDTGADSSAIWATGIKERQGVLHFVLFAPESPYYNGKQLKTRDYTVTTVRNSFGHKEFRYKVSLHIRLGDRVINVRFTLANRQSNRFPVLIGRRTLQGKFLVDVAKNAKKPTAEILLLTVAKTASVIKMAQNLSDLRKKVQVTIATYDELEFNLGGQFDRVALPHLSRDIASYDLVHFKTTVRHQDIAAAAAQYLQKRGIPFVDKAIAHYPARSKLYQYVILRNHGLPVPHSLFMLPQPLSLSFARYKAVLGLPFILKDIDGRRGENNHLITSLADFKKVTKRALQQDIRLIGQRYIANEGDYRVLVLGHRVSLIIKRQASKGHLHNASLGGKTTLVELPKFPTKIKHQAISAAVAMDRQIAGVDMVQDKTSGSWYCLEVNDGPQIATGAFLPEKHTVLADYIERIASK